MGDATDDTDASVENVLSLVVLVVISCLAVLMAAVNFGAASPYAPSSRSSAYPIKIGLNWPNSLDPLRSHGDQPVTSPGMNKIAGHNEGNEAKTLLPNSQANPDAAQNTRAGDVQTARSASPAPFLVSDFNLGSGPSAANAIEIRKPVLVNGHAAGTIRMRIDAAAEVYVREDDIAKLLAGKIALPAHADADYVALDKIRDRGIDVRYDAGKDALDITT